MSTSTRFSSSARCAMPASMPAHSLADNNSVEGRARNRRVEITLLATNPPAN